MKKSVAIIGGGTAGLFAAAFLDTDLYDVTIYEKKGSVGRKFLVAGDGGFNLTHSEVMEKFIQRYVPNDFLDQALRSFTNLDFIDWLDEIGIPTFIGSSKRVFPEKGIKPIQVLNAINTFLKSRNVYFKYNKEFTGWSVNEHVVFNSEEIVKADYYIFAIGGASWKITGSDGKWKNIFAHKGIPTIPFKASNCAFKINWLATFIKEHEGKPIKNISFTIDDHCHKGEVVITSFGIEGNAIYGLSSMIQSNLEKQNKATVYLDNKPTLTHDVILEKLEQSNYYVSKTLREVLKLSGPQVALIKTKMSKEDFLNNHKLATMIKNLPLVILAAGPIDEAISTTGGIDRNALTPSFELKSIKNTFTIGEMVDWNAPTGGYLIQGCVSMGVFIARHLNQEK